MNDQVASIYSQAEIFDWAAAVFSYWDSFLILVALCFLVTGALILANRRKKKRPPWGLIARSLLILLISWLTYFGSTLGTNLTLSCLDSENNRLAATVYETCFKIDLDQAIKLAKSEHESGNVRFYACCRISDILATKSNPVIKTVLDQVENIEPFTTGFGGTNFLTPGFFVPNHAEGPFQVREIIEWRLKSLKAKGAVREK
jgi:hypothetical protein